MSNNSSSSSSAGIGFGGLLAILFIALKLIGISPVAKWSWLWVLSPIWVPLGIGLVILAIVILVSVFSGKR